MALLRQLTSKVSILPNVLQSRTHAVSGIRCLRAYSNTILHKVLAKKNPDYYAEVRAFRTAYSANKFRKIPPHQFHQLRTSTTKSSFIEPCESENECTDAEDEESTEIVFTEAELEMFNMQIEEQSSEDFFGVAQLPAAKVPDAILTTYSSEAARAVNHAEAFLFLRLMEYAMIPGVLESAVDNFSMELFRLLRYDNVDLGLAAKFSTELPLRVCQQVRMVRTSLCVLDPDDIWLLIQQDEQAATNPLEKLSIGQLVAKSIAAFDYNNYRRRGMGKKKLSNYLMPGIIMRGTTPFFYKIQVTQNLVDCVEKGNRSAEPTKIYQHQPVFRSGFDRGMIPLANRKVALDSYEAFKIFVFQTQPE